MVELVSFDGLFGVINLTTNSTLVLNLHGFSLLSSMSFEMSDQVVFSTGSKVAAFNFAGKGFSIGVLALMVISVVFSSKLVVANPTRKHGHTF